MCWKANIGNLVYTPDANSESDDSFTFERLCVAREMYIPGPNLLIFIPWENSNALDISHLLRLFNAS